jgi:hypothetical protein
LITILLESAIGNLCFVLLHWTFPIKRQVGVNLPMLFVRVCTNENMNGDHVICTCLFKWEHEWGTILFVRVCSNENMNGDNVMCTCLYKWEHEWGPCYLYVFVQMRTWMGTMLFVRVCSNEYMNGESVRLEHLLLQISISSRFWPSEHPP